MNFFNRPNPEEFRPLSREVTLDGDDLKSPNAYLAIAPKYVDMLCGLSFWRGLSTEQLFELLPKKYHRFVPPVGRDVSMVRAVIIGMLASKWQIEEHLAQKFVERLSGG